MKNFLVVIANGPADMLRGVGYQYHTVYAADEKKAEEMGQRICDHLEGYWEVRGAEPLE
jgi:hypothetical protein